MAVGLPMAKEGWSGTCVCVSCVFLLELILPAPVGR